MPMSDLEIFARVVTAGNMSAAGREMELSPAVVSKRISHLEQRLAARLFQRTTRQLTLTETGQGFYDRVVNILAGIEEAEAYVTRRNTVPQGTLKITAPTAFGRMHIAPYLSDFLNQYPDIRLDLDLSDTFVDIVGAGFDAAIRVAELEDSSLVARKLAPSHRVICAAPDYIKEHGTPKTLAELTKHNCLAPTAQELWRLQGKNGPESIRVSGNIRTNSTEVVREAVLAGIGIALRSTWDVGPELQSGQLKVIMPEYQQSPRVAIYAVYPCRQYVPAKLRVFVDYLAGRFGPEPYWNKGLDIPHLH
ncbi:MAG: LysR family transcriptional regulator [Hyphomicrobiales bacterium]|nr:LysR family transcriptional regulator [Hyphomicrobiales bacterium]